MHRGCFLRLSSCFAIRTTFVSVSITMTSRSCLKLKKISTCTCLFDFHQLYRTTDSKEHAGVYKVLTTHVTLMVRGSWGNRRDRGARGDDRFTRVLQGGWKIPQHGGVGHRRKLMVTFSTEQDYLQMYNCLLCQGRDNHWGGRFRRKLQV